MKIQCSVLLLFVSLSSTSYAQFEHCNALLEHGINNITTLDSASHATAYNYNKYCRNTSSDMTDARAAEASASIFGFGSGSGSGNSNRMRKEVDNWCKEKKSQYSNSERLFQEARSTNSSALAAWNSCQNAAKKQVQISLKNLAKNNEFLHFGIDSTSDGDIYLTSILQKGYKCHISYRSRNMTSENIDDKASGEKSSGYENVAPREQIAIKNSNVHVSCQRQEPVNSEKNGIGRIQYESGSVVINTDGPSFSIDIPEIVSDYYYTPKSVVMPFQLEGCPSGWSEYKLAYGRFIRGIDKSNKKIDPEVGRKVGSIQEDLYGKHSHDASMEIGAEPLSGAAQAQEAAGAHGQHGTYYTASQHIRESGGSETRPKNVALLYCIKN